MADGRIPHFKDRLRELRGNTTQAEFAESIGTSRANIGFYENGERIADAVTLLKIATKCKVSIDWLLGISDVKSIRADIKEIAGATGLSEIAVETLLDAERMRSDYAESDCDNDREGMWRRYLQLISCFLENSSDLWISARRFSDYCDTVYALGTDSAEIYTSVDMFDGFLARMNLDSRKHEVVSMYRLREFRLYELMKSIESAIKEKAESVIFQEKKNRVEDRLSNSNGRQEG